MKLLESKQKPKPATVKPKKKNAIPKNVKIINDKDLEIIRKNEKELAETNRFIEKMQKGTKTIRRKITKLGFRDESNQYTVRLNVAIEAEVYMAERSKKSNPTITMIKGNPYVILKQEYLTVPHNLIKKYYGRHIYGKNKSFDTLKDDFGFDKTFDAKKDYEKDFYRVLSNFNSKIQHCVSWFDEIVQSKTTQQIVSRKEIKAYHDQLMLSNQYITYEINENAQSIKELFKVQNKTDYIDTHFKESACWLTAIIDNFKKYWDNKNSKKLIYETLYEMMKGIEYVEGADTGFTFEEVENQFFHKMNLGFVVFDKSGNVIHRFTPEKFNGNISQGFRIIYLIIITSTLLIPISEVLSNG